jgi:hypothetical protein
LNHLLPTAVAVASLGILSASATELQFVTVQYGQGGTVTFFKPSASKATSKDSRVGNGQAKVKWIQQSIPNGSAISYAVQESPRYDIAPLK